MNISRQELKELPVEGNWLKLYQKTTGRMTAPFDVKKIYSTKSHHKKVDTGIVYKGETVTSGDQK